MEGRSPEMRSLALTPTWSVATVMTIFVVLSLLVERSIYRLSLVCKTYFWSLPFVLFFFLLCPPTVVEEDPQEPSLSSTGENERR